MPKRKRSRTANGAVSSGVHLSSSAMFQTFRFFDLLPELRNLIYVQLMAFSTIELTYQDNLETVNRYIHSYLLVNRQFYNEFKFLLPAIYEHATMQLEYLLLYQLIGLARFPARFGTVHYPAPDDSKLALLKTSLERHTRHLRVAGKIFYPGNGHDKPTYTFGALENLEQLDSVLHVAIEPTYRRSVTVMHPDGAKQVFKSCREVARHLESTWRDDPKLHWDLKHRIKHVSIKPQRRGSSADRKIVCDHRFRTHYGVALAEVVCNVSISLYTEKEATERKRQEQSDPTCLVESTKPSAEWLRRVQASNKRPMDWGQVGRVPSYYDLIGHPLA